MKLIFEDIKRRKTDKSEDIIFLLETSGFYLIQVSARTKGEKELGETDDEDLRIEVDKREFPKLDNPERYFDSPASFSGGQSKNLKKTVFFILRLNNGRHTISLIPDVSATIEEIKVWQISVRLPTDIVEVSLEERAEDGDRRPWMTFVLIDLGLKEFSVTLNLKRRFIDSDDVKVIIDGKIKRNHRSLLHKFWYFIASYFTSETQKETLVIELLPKLHYIEFWADRMPTFKSITFSGIKTISTEEIKEKIREKAKEFGLDPELMIRLAQFESDFDPYVISPKGAKGIFQLMDIAIKQVAKLGFAVHGPFDVEQNITSGTIYFHWLYEMYKNTENPLEKTLAAWNWGQKYVPKEGPLDWNSLPSSTKQFIKNVIGEK